MPFPRAVPETSRSACPGRSTLPARALQTERRPLAAWRKALLHSAKLRSRLPDVLSSNARYAHRKVRYRRAAFCNLPKRRASPPRCRRISSRAGTTDPTGLRSAPIPPDRTPSRRPGSRFPCYSPPAHIAHCAAVPPGRLPRADTALHRPGHPLRRSPPRAPLPPRPLHPAPTSPPATHRRSFRCSDRGRAVRSALPALPAAAGPPPIRRFDRSASRSAALSGLHPSGSLPAPFSRGSCGNTPLGTPAGALGEHPSGPDSPYGTPGTAAHSSHVGHGY